MQIILGEHVDTVEIEIVVIIDEDGNYTIEPADNDSETAQRHATEFGQPGVMATHRLRLTLPVPAATVHQGKITAGGPIELRLVKD